MTPGPLRHMVMGLAAALFVATTTVGTPIAAASDGMLATVRLPRASMADGEPLAAGLYSVRLSDAAVTPVVGQAPDSERWVEFLQSGAVKGRELATVLTGPAVRLVAKEAPPAAGQSRVELLAGGRYLRVWINQAGTNYLVHLALADK